MSDNGLSSDERGVDVKEVDVSYPSPPLTFPSLSLFRAHLQFFSCIHHPMCHMSQLHCGRQTLVVRFCLDALNQRLPSKGTMSSKWWSIFRMFSTEVQVHKIGLSFATSTTSFFADYFKCSFGLPLTFNVNVQTSQFTFNSFKPPRTRIIEWGLLCRHDVSMSGKQGVGDTSMERCSS